MIGIVSVISGALKLADRLTKMAQDKELRDDERRKIALAWAEASSRGSDYVADARRRGIRLHDSERGPRTPDRDA